MFDFDPDTFEDEMNDPGSDCGEDAADEMSNDADEIEIEDGFEVEEADDSTVEAAIIAGTIFGLGVEEGRDEATGRKTSKEIPEKGERSPGAVSLKELGKPTKSKLRPFEQWIDDVIHGRKTLDDEL